MIYKIPPSGAPRKWIKDKLRKGELVSGVTKLDFGQGRGNPVPIEASSQVIQATTPPVPINKPGEGRRKLAAATGRKTVLGVRVVAGGTYVNKCAIVKARI